MGRAPAGRGSGLGLEDRRLAALVRTAPLAVRPGFVGLAPMVHPVTAHVSADLAPKARRPTVPVREVHVRQVCPGRPRAFAALAPKDHGTARR